MAAHFPELGYQVAAAQQGNNKMPHDLEDVRRVKEKMPRWIVHAVEADSHALFVQGNADKRGDVLTLQIFVLQGIFFPYLLDIPDDNDFVLAKGIVPVRIDFRRQVLKRRLSDDAPAATHS